MAVALNNIRDLLMPGLMDMRKTIDKNLYNNLFNAWTAELTRLAEPAFTLEEINAAQDQIQAATTARNP